MPNLSDSETLTLFLALGLLLGLARTLGEIVHRFNQPTVLGELIAGMILGPTVVGTFWPQTFTSLFASGDAALVIQGFATVGIALFLLMAGMEVDLSTARERAGDALVISILGVAAPFSMGFACTWFFPEAFGREGQDRLTYALFFASAMSMSALPMIAKTLLDLGLYRSRLGMLIMTSALMNDLSDWTVFVLILGLMGRHAAGEWWLILLALGFAAFMLTLGRMGLNRLLGWVGRHSEWPGGMLGAIIVSAMLAAAFTHAIGMHAVFGAFLAGVAVGSSGHVTEKTRAAMKHFIAFFFAPIFFASIGLRVNLSLHFDPLLSLAVFSVAMASKVLGCGLGARLRGLPPREALAVGFGLSSRGAIEIIVGLMALQHGLIAERTFVALVFTAVMTSLLAGPMIKFLIRRSQHLSFLHFLPEGGFVAPLKATERRAAILELAHAAVNGSAGAAGFAKAMEADAGLDPQRLAAAALTAEEQHSYGLCNGVAMPHALVDGLARPLVAVGASPAGIDFEACDGQPSRLIFLVLAPAKDHGLELEILSDIGEAFLSRALVDRCVAAASAGEFRRLAQARGA